MNDKMVVEERCGKVAKNRVTYGDGKVIYLCTKHFSNNDIQHQVTRKLIKREYLEESTERCQAEVVRRKVDEE